MIARGDLAVECGWERLAQLQEEILWICEAAQVPVIWATQVLELNMKKGRPSRAEISDAAMSEQADCVMLNKGPHIIATIRMLDNILRRMQGSRKKRAARLKKLRLS
jgi:pyruvate kinase